MDRILILCPTYQTQTTFDPIRKLVYARDVWDGKGKKDIQEMEQIMDTTQKRRIKEGLKKTRFLVIVDDMAGTTALHGNRISPFGHLSIQTPHLSCS